MSPVRNGISNGLEKISRKNPPLPAAHQPETPRGLSKELIIITETKITLGKTLKILK